MSKITRTKSVRAIVTETHQVLGYKEAQPRQPVGIDLLNGFTAIVAMAPGQAINVAKLRERVLARDYPISLIAVIKTPPKKDEPVPEVGGVEAKSSV